MTIEKIVEFVTDLGDKARTRQQELIVFSLNTAVKEKVKIAKIAENNGRMQVIVEILNFIKKGLEEKANG